MARTLKLQVQISVDGFIAGPNGEMDWVSQAWDDALIAEVGAMTDPVTTILLGRRLAEGFIPYWKNVAADPGHPEHAAGVKFTETPKIVFSRTLTASPWENTLLASSELAQEVTELKKQNGGDIIAYGGADFVSSLLANDLIDEYNLFVNPAVIGKGMSIFTTLTSSRALKLETAVPFSCGIVLLRYRKV